MKIIGSKRISVPQCNSTNTLLAQLDAKGRLEAGTVLTTENQMAGRGQAGNQWLSESSQNLTFSFLLRPSTIPPSQVFDLTVAVALGAAEALENLSGLEITVKWPNDLLVQNRKLGGILIENQIQGTTWAQAIVGIGLNINQKKFLVPQATSLGLETNSHYSRQTVLDLVLAKIDAQLIALFQHEREKLYDMYYKKLFRYGVPSDFKTANGTVFNGTIKGTDAFGRLVVETEGTIRKFDFKEVSFLL